MADDSNLQIKVTATAAEAKAEVKSFTQAIKDLDAITKNANETVKKSTEALRSDYVNSLKAAEDRLASLTQKTESSSVGSDKLQFSMSRVTRELIVLGREAVTGNFNRIPGSLIVLSEAFTNLQGVITITRLAAVAGFAAIAAVIYETWKNNADFNRELETTHTRLVGMGDASFTVKAIRDLFTEIKSEAQLSTEEVNNFIGSIARLKGMTPQGTGAFGSLIDDLNKVTGGTKETIKLIEDMSGRTKLSASEAEKAFKDFAQGELDELNVAKASGDTHRVLSETMKILENHIVNNTELQKANTEERRKSIEAAIAKMGEGALYAGNLVASNIALEEQNSLLDATRAKIKAYLDASKEPGPDFLKESPTNKSRSDTAWFLEDLKAMSAAYKKEHAEMDAVDRASASVEMAFTNDKNRLAIKAAKEQVAEEKKAMTEIAAAHRALDSADLFWMKRGTRDYAAEARERKRIREEEFREELRIDQEKVRILTQAEDQLVRNIMQGKMKLNQVLFQLTSQLIQNEISADLRYLTAKLIMSKEEQAVDRATNQGGFLARMNWEKLWTQAVTLLSGERVAVKEAEAVDTAAAAEAAQVADAIVAVQKNHADAVLVFGGVFANLAPLMGPAAAGPAGASMAAVEAMGASLLPSFDVGAWNVPGDMMANIHQGEMIIPKPFAQSVRENGGGGGGINLNVSTMDAQSFTAFINNPTNMRRLASRLKTYAGYAR